MTSVIKITFVSQKEISVDIDNIDSISPRGIELAVGMLNKKYLGMKGANLFQFKRAQEEAAAKAAEEVAVATRIEQLRQEELAKSNSAALEAATKRFNALKQSEQEALIAAAKSDVESKELNEFLSSVAQVVASGGAPVPIPTPKAAEPHKTASKK